MPKKEKAAGQQHSESWRKKVNRFQMHAGKQSKKTKKKCQNLG